MLQAIPLRLLPPFGVRNDTKLLLAACILTQEVS